MECGMYSIYQTSTINRSLYVGCGTPPTYYAHAIGTRIPVENNNKKMRIIELS